jgi:hypothetical protein
MRYTKFGPTGIDVSVICRRRPQTRAPRRGSGLDLDLADEDIAALEEPYQPHPIAGHV